ncbi:MAG: UDP-N-acetylmuramoyl-L-alanine--D-glutamate ligase [Muribaculaceae bacterium]|nr:UDP-N-acetylmuramoyl-L-alanine--D-glutamate ligase [Muribaculaceae bacterium]
MKDKKNRLVVLGGGESGYGAAVLGRKLGMEVLLSDSGTLKEPYRSLLVQEGIPFEEGGHTPEKILDADLVVKSPGIPETAPLVVALRDKGVEVISEIEFAGRHTDARMICITGSNGKTTTTSLIYHILRQAGRDVGLAGNIGHSLALQVARDPKPCYVIELSSFQLDGMYRFKADVAVLMNITPDHLDRYDHKMQNYVESKFRIIRNQTASDVFIYWDGDPVIKAEFPRHDIKARLLPFDADTLPVLPKEDIPIKGLHNLFNALAATLACRAVGLTDEEIAAGIRTFKAVPHRLEFIREKDGVRWINDSKATNVASTYYALEAMDRPTVLILGGTDKGNDYSEILPFVKEKVRHIVCMGVDNAKIVKFFSGHVEGIIDTHSLAEAVECCRRVARPGETVLLSPCCASFDLFKNYEQRGDLFREAVTNL